MSKINEELFAQVVEEAKDLDVGPGAVYAVIAHHLQQDAPDFACGLADTAYTIVVSSSEPPKRSVSRDTDLLLECFSLLCFQPITKGVYGLDEYETWVAMMENSRDYLLSMLGNIKKAQQAH